MKKSDWLYGTDRKDLVFVAKTFKGYEDLLSRELLDLGAREVNSLNRAVSFAGDQGFLYKACLSLATALKILMPIARFSARTPEQLYAAASRLPWHEVIGDGQSFAIQFTVHSEHFPHSQFAALKLKDALVDQMRKKTGKRPNVERFRPDIQIDLMISDTQVHVSLDASGDPLFKRGYRKETGKAPLNEVLAAGLIKRSGWNGKKDLLDPFCGSGTLLIEACLQHMQIPPGIFRDGFGFQKWPDYNEELYTQIRNARLDQVRDPQVRFLGMDKDVHALRKMHKNLEQAELLDVIRMEQGDFFHSDPPAGSEGMLLANPPYGRKMPVDAGSFFSSIGDRLKKHYAGWNAWVLLPEEIGSIGLRPSKKFPVLNGDISCKWSGFELFQGSKKQRYQG